MASGELEDAVTFLENTRKLYPNVTSLLTTSQLMALDMSPKEPFDDKTINEDFVKLAEAYFVAKNSIDQAKSALRTALMEPMAKGKELDVDAERKVISCMELVGCAPTSFRVRWTISYTARLNNVSPQMDISLA